MVEVPTEGERGPHIPAAAYLPPPGIWDKVRPHPLTYPGQPGSLHLLYPRLPRSCSSKGARPRSTWHLQPLPRGQVGQSCSSKGYEKFPRLQRPASGSGKEIK